MIETVFVPADFTIETEDLLGCIGELRRHANKENRMGYSSWDLNYPHSYLCFPGKEHYRLSTAYPSDSNPSCVADLSNLLNRVCRRKNLKISYREAAPSTFIGASNFFELDIAVILILFRMNSGAALATVVGVLVEVPVMFSLLNHE